MAKRFLTPINVLNAASDPVSAAEGDLYYNTATDKLKIYSNSTWVDVSSGGGGGVTSLTGTTNQIDVSASTGAITLSLPNSGVSASSYGSASVVPTFTVDAKGRLTAASNTTIAIAQSAVANLTTDLAAKANTSGKLSQFASTTSAELAGVISDETGSGALVFGTSPTLTTPRIASNSSINDSNGNELIKFPTAVASAVNELSISNAATGQPVSITTTGGDTNIGLNITTKGTGAIVIDTGTGAGEIDLKPGSSSLRLYDDDSSHYYQFVTGNRTANYNITLPAGNVTLVSGTMVATSGATFTGTIVAPAATTSLAPIRIPHGTAPSSPTNGDIWTTTTGLFARINGSTVGPLAPASAGINVDGGIPNSNYGGINPIDGGGVT